MGRRIDVDQQDTPASLVNLQVHDGVTSESLHFRQLNIAPFCYRLMRYDLLTEFGFALKKHLPAF